MEGPSTVIQAMRLHILTASLLILSGWLCVASAQDNTANTTPAAVAPSDSKPQDARKTQPVEVWEYSAYKARVWLSISPTLGLSENTKQLIQQKIAQ